MLKDNCVIQVRLVPVVFCSKAQNQMTMMRQTGISYLYEVYLTLFPRKSLRKATDTCGVQKRYGKYSQAKKRPLKRLPIQTNAKFQWVCSVQFKMFTQGVSFL